MFDEDLIIASFAQQYGIRLLREDISVREYRKLLKGLNGETSLGYVVNIRSETDPKKIKEMTKTEKRIRSEWQRFRAKQKQNNGQTITMTVEQFQQALKNLAGGGNR